MEYEIKYYSKHNIQWHYERVGLWVGDRFPISNLSQGYHGIMKQWWERYFTNGKVLLISEGEQAKQDFARQYPTWQIQTIDLFPEIANSHTCDLIGDIAALENPLERDTYDLIINQATLEHVYNPFQAISNMFASLRPGGILVSHTHPPGFEYHSYPRDYFRFMIDWWIDLPKLVKGIELLEIFEGYHHVFSCYQKIPAGPISSGPAQTP